MPLVVVAEQLLPPPPPQLPQQASLPAAPAGPPAAGCLGGDGSCGDCWASANSGRPRAGSQGCSWRRTRRGSIPARTTSLQKISAEIKIRFFRHLPVLQDGSSQCPAMMTAYPHAVLAQFFFFFSQFEGIGAAAVRREHPQAPLVASGADLARPELVNNDEPSMLAQQPPKLLVGAPPPAEE